MDVNAHFHLRFLTFLPPSLQARMTRSSVGRGRAKRAAKFLTQVIICTYPPPNRPPNRRLIN